MSLVGILHGEGEGEGGGVSDRAPYRGDCYVFVLGVGERVIDESEVND